MVVFKRIFYKNSLFLYSYIFCFENEALRERLKLEIDFEDITKIKLLKKGEYKGVHELRGKLNYGLEVKENGNTTLKHEPEIKLGTTINVTEKLSLLSDNSNKVTLEHKVGQELTTIKNDFKTTNKIKVKMSKGLDLETLAEYKLGADFKKSNNEKEYTHALLTGGTLSIKKEIEEVNVESKIEGRYLFDTKHKPTEKANDLRHQGFVWIEISRYDLIFGVNELLK